MATVVSGNSVEEEYMWSCSLDKDNKEFMWMPEEPVKGPDANNEDEKEELKPGHRLLIKNAILMPDAEKDAVHVVQIECEGYNSKKIFCLRTILHKKPYHLIQEAAMSPTPFDWSKLIADITDESFGIPFDVVFQIVENDQVHEVKAHKMILGMVSTTFKTMFYSTDVGDKTAKVIKIEKTTAPAFQTMMDAVYSIKTIGESLRGKSVHEVFDVVNLVEMYHIKELMEAVKQHLAKYPITDDTVLEVAGEAMEYTNMFEAESNDLLLTCAKFLKSKLKDLNSAIKYAAANKDHKEVFAALLALMNDLAPTECPNCKYEVCQNGEGIKDEEFRVGLIVANNRDSGFSERQGRDYGTGKVMEVSDTSVTVVSVKPGVTGTKFNGINLCYMKTKDHTPLFLFSCN